MLSVMFSLMFRLYLPLILKCKESEDGIRNVNLKFLINTVVHATRNFLRSSSENVFLIIIIFLYVSSVNGGYCCVYGVFGTTCLRFQSSSRAKRGPHV